MIEQMAWSLLALVLPHTPASPSELRVQVEVFDWHLRNPAPKDMVGCPRIPANAKPAASFSVNTIAEKPFAAEVVVASRKLQLSGIVQNAVEKIHMVSIRFLMENSKSREKEEISPDADTVRIAANIKLSPDEPLIIGGISSVTTRDGQHYYTHQVIRLKIVKQR